MALISKGYVRSGARAAPTISDINKTNKGRFVIRRINSFLWMESRKKGKCSAMLWSFNFFTSLRYDFV